MNNAINIITFFTIKKIDFKVKDIELKIKKLIFNYFNENFKEN
jgi:hypothetical protein